MEAYIWEIKDIISEWFETHDITILNVYIVSLIAIEQLHSQNTKKKYLVKDGISFVVNYLFETEKINKEECKIIEEEISEEIETLEGIKTIVFDLTNNPNLLQKNKFVPNYEKRNVKKLVACRTVSMEKFSIGTIKTDKV